jgi:hypothetical protein
MQPLTRWARTVGMAGWPCLTREMTIMSAPLQYRRTLLSGHLCVGKHIDKANFPPMMFGSASYQRYLQGSPGRHYMWSLTHTPVCFAHPPADHTHALAVRVELQGGQHLEGPALAVVCDLNSVRAAGQGQAQEQCSSITLPQLPGCCHSQCNTGGPHAPFHKWGQISARCTDAQADHTGDIFRQYSQACLQPVPGIRSSLHQRLLIRGGGLQNMSHAAHTMHLGCRHHGTITTKCSVSIEYVLLA